MAGNLGRSSLVLYALQYSYTLAENQSQNTGQDPTQRPVESNSVGTISAADKGYAWGGL